MSSARSLCGIESALDVPSRLADGFGFTGATSWLDENGAKVILGILQTRQGG
jgi:hypothetical protein